MKWASQCSSSSVSCLPMLCDQLPKLLLLWPPCNDGLQSQLECKIKLSFLSYLLLGCLVTATEKSQDKQIRQIVVYVLRMSSSRETIQMNRSLSWKFFYVRAVEYPTQKAAHPREAMLTQVFQKDTVVWRSHLEKSFSDRSWLKRTTSGGKARSPLNLPVDYRKKLYLIPM